MTRVSAGPYHESIVVLGRDHHFGHTCIAHSLDPLVGVESRGGKHRRILLACTPFAPGECVGSEVDKSNISVGQRSELSRGGHRMGGQSSYAVATGAGFHSVSIAVGNSI